MKKFLLNRLGEGIVFASKYSFFRCTLIACPDCRLRLELHDWAPGLIVDLTDAKTYKTRKEIK